MSWVGRESSPRTGNRRSQDALLLDIHGMAQPGRLLPITLALAGSAPALQPNQRTLTAQCEWHTDKAAYPNAASVCELK